MRLKFWRGQPEAARAAPQTASPSAPPSDFDVRAIGRAVLRRKAWIIIPTILAAALSFAIVNMIAPRYQSEARILIDGRENIFLRPNADRIDERGTLDLEAVTSQVQLVLSRDLAREIIKKNKLYERPEFDPALKGVSPLKALLGLIGIGRSPLTMTAEERVLEAYYNRLTAYAVEKSRVIVIEFQSSDPELAAQVANSIAQGYLVLQQSARQQQARVAGQWLSGEIDSLRRKVADAESRVEEFRSKASLFVGTNNTTLSNQQMGEFNTQLNNSRALKSDAETKARLIREMLQSGRPIEVTDVTNSELLRRLTEQRVTLRAQLAEQSSTLLDSHPRIKELKAQINDLDRQIREEAGRVARSLENDARIAGARVEALNANLEQLKKQAGSTNEQDVHLRALEREAKAQRDLLESYLAKYREATTRETIDTGPSDGRVISAAIVSNTPAYPKKLPIVLIATLATMMMSAGFIVTGELLRITAPRSLPVEPAPIRVATRPVTGRLPRVAPVSQQDEIARLADDFLAAGTEARKITVISAETTSGTSLTALKLARLMSRKADIVLVDLSLESAALAAASIDQAAPGLTDLASGTASFGEIITRDKMSRVQIVGAGQARAGRDVLNSPQLAIVIDALAQVYDHVILDAGMLEDLPDEVARSNAQAVLVTQSTFDASIREAVEVELIKAGFNGVSVLHSANDNVPPEPDDSARTAA